MSAKAMKKQYENSKFRATEVYRSEVDDVQWHVPPECKTLSRRHFGHKGTEDTDSGGEEIFNLNDLATGQTLDLVPTSKTDEFTATKNKNTQLCAYRRLMRRTNLDTYHSFKFGGYLNSDEPRTLQYKSTGYFSCLQLEELPIDVAKCRPIS